MMNKIKNSVKHLLYKGPPLKIAENFRKLDKENLVELENHLKIEYYSNYSVQDQSADLERDMRDQLSGRLHKFRNEVVPWLNSVRELRGATILEIGCGTGSSTVAFAEQGARVTALDVDEASLSVARKRVSVYGLQAEFVHGNGEAVDQIFAGKQFDIILFPATLEHMTYRERINSLRAVYKLMHPGNLLVTVETPNRLWFYDFHTAYLPFYFWLPEELAFDYSQHSARNNFKELYREQTPDRMMHFIRRGRGVSFHDFEIAFEDMSTMPVVSSMEGFSKNKVFQFITDRLKSRGYLKYKKFIRQYGPAHHEGFFEPWLDLILKKTK